MAEIALKVDVDTLRGTRIGVPRLLEAFNQRRARATFYFSLGPDHTGWALRRVFRPGFMAKVSRTSVLKHYGLKTLLYGVLLPGPDIGRRAAAPMRAVAAAGHETGIHCFDHVYWQDNVARRGRAWTEQQVERAARAYAAVFGAPAQSHAAAGWQLNRTLLECEDAMAMSHASDTRGTGPFIPVLDGYTARCPQLPTTLPTLDELIGLDGRSEQGALAELLDRTGPSSSERHVYTLHAELEGQALMPLLATLLDTWQARGHRLVAMGELRRTLNLADLPRHRIVYGTLPGRSGLLAVQGERIAA